MVTLTDEEKAKKVFGDVDDQKSDETSEDDKASTDNEEDQSLAADESGQTDSDASQSSQDTTLTKPFPWLKGETPEEWASELAKAYENSTNEALKLKKQLDDGNITVEQAKQIIANQSTVPQTQATAAQPTFDVNSHPALQYAASQMEREMITAFDSFAKEYPQARDPQDFDRMTKAADGAALAFRAANGRMPSYSELYQATANLLGWQAASKSAKRDAAIKEGAASSQVTGGSKPPARKTEITESQLQVARRLFPNQSDEDLIKDLSNYVK